jgi:subtilisin
LNKAKTILCLQSLLKQSNPIMKLLFCVLCFTLIVSLGSAFVSEDEKSNLRAAQRSLQDDLDLDLDVYIVEFKPNTPDVAQKAQQLAAAHKGQVGFIYKHALQGFAFHGKNPQGLLNNPNVLSVTRDSIVHASAQDLPTGIQRIFADDKAYLQLDGSTGCMCDAVVAVIDTGVQFDHPDLNVNTAKSVDCTGGSSCNVGGNDDHYHGTHVAGTIAAINNNQGVVGVCPGAEVWAIKVLDRRGSGSWSGVLAGIDYVTANGVLVDVANMSLGGSGCDSVMCAAIDGAKAAGVAFAVAAGNSNANAQNYQPACCSGAMSKYF